MSKRMFPGYGRGWSEEKAKGILPRLIQRMREPATKTDYVWIGGVAVLGSFFVALALA